MKKSQSGKAKSQEALHVFRQFAWLLAGALVSQNALCNQRMNFLQRLVTFATFGRGWTSRVADIRATALTDAAKAPAPDQPKGVNDMTLLDGYKTYAIGILMLIVGAAQFAGLAIPVLGRRVRLGGLGLMSGDI